MGWLIFSEDTRRSVSATTAAIEHLTLPHSQSVVLNAAKRNIAFFVFRLALPNYSTHACLYLHRDSGSSSLLLGIMRR